MYYLILLIKELRDILSNSRGFLFVFFSQGLGIKRMIEEGSVLDLETEFIKVNFKYFWLEFKFYFS